MNPPASVSFHFLHLSSNSLPPLSFPHRQLLSLPLASNPQHLPSTHALLPRLAASAASNFNQPNVSSLQTSSSSLYDRDG